MPSSYSYPEKYSRGYIQVAKHADWRCKGTNKRAKYKGKTKVFTFISERNSSSTAGQGTNKRAKYKGKTKVFTFISERNSSSTVGQGTKKRRKYQIPANDFGKLNVEYCPATRA